MKDPITPAPQPKVEKRKKLIAFTFDDGPHYKNTKEIMAEFEKYNGRATFFMLGQNVKANPDIVKDVYKRGHEVANHSLGPFHTYSSTTSIYEKRRCK